MITNTNTIPQPLADALDSLKLTEKNKELAGQYLDLDLRESPELLKEAEYQDFSLFTDLEKKAAYTWCRELGDQAGEAEQEQFARYVRFAAAVGGASACYVLIRGLNMDHIARKLTKEQRASFWAELYAHKENTLHQGFFSILAGMGREDPEVLVRAASFCRGQNDAARILLLGEYLFCTGQKGIHNEQTDAQAAELKERMLHRLPELFQGNGCTEKEQSMLRDFVLNAKAKQPFPEEVLLVLKGKQGEWDVHALLTCCSCMALEYGEVFGTFLRLLAAVCTESRKKHFPKLCRYAADQDWFYGHLQFFLTKLPIKPIEWMEWSLMTREESIWRYMVKNCPEVFADLEELSLWSYDRLLEGVRRMDDALLYEKCYDAEVYRQKAAEELCTDFDTGASTVRDYLLGEASLDQVLPFVKEWRKNSSGYYGGKNDRLEILRDLPDQAQLYRRGLVMEGLLMHGAFFRHYMFDLDSAGIRRGLNAEEIGKILDLLGEEQLPVSYQLDTLACIHESCSSKSQEDFQKECVKVLENRIKQWGEAYKKSAINGAAMTRIFCMLAMDLHGQEYKEALLSCASDSSKQVRQILLGIYENHREWEPEIKEMLASKKQKERQMAILVLKQWGAGQYQKELQEALQKEKNGKLIEYLQKLAGTDPGDIDLEELAKNCLKGNRRQKILWALDPSFENIHTADGKEAPKNYVPAILVCYASMEVPGLPKDAVKLADALHKAELSAYMRELYQKWLDQGAEAKKKWVLYAASVHGGREMVPLLYRLIKELPAKSRGAMAVEAVRALTLNGTSEALLLVDQISRKFKYRQVKKGAQEALANAAAELGISREELEDRIIPDLGFDEKMERVFDYGTRKFIVRLTPALETEVLGENNKRMKNIPAPGRQDDPEKAEAARRAYREMKKQLKTVAAAQKLRFEQVLMTGRTWSAVRWKELFVNNPLMHRFSIGLIWGVYEGDALKETFRYMEDGTFNTMEEETYTFKEGDSIGLVHPAELSEEEREAWKEQLSDYEITQPVDQLARPVFLLKEEERAESFLSRFQGTVVNALSLSGKLLRQGWYRGPVGDNGEYSTFCREDGKIGAELSFSGCGIQEENTNVVLRELSFYKKQLSESEEESRLLLVPEEVPLRYFSEIVLQTALAAGAETI